MAGFEKLCFRGAFRNYQERVLQNAGAEKIVSKAADIADIVLA